MKQFRRGAVRRSVPRAFVPGLSVRRRIKAPVRLTLRICNYAHVDHSYGRMAAEEVVAEIFRRLNAALPIAADVVIHSGGVLQVGLWTDPADEHDFVQAVLPAWLFAFCATTLRQPVPLVDGVVCVWLAGSWEMPDGESERVFPFCGPPTSDDEEGGGLYRADMALAVDLLPLLSAREREPVVDDGSGLVLYWQSVVNGRGGVLYHEALCRPIGRDGLSQSPQPLLLALERLGFACLLDLHVVSAVIDELEAAPGTVLAANVSAQSLSCTQSWGEVLDRLQCRPDIARRLVWEITETAFIADMNRAVAFASLVKSFGCRIAIDDFGVGFASIRQLLIFSPDIIKIDRLFLDRAVMGARDASIFHHLVELALSFGGEVVVEGVETVAQLRLIEALGPVWQQGYLHAVPSMTRNWLEGQGAPEALL